MPSLLGCAEWHLELERESLIESDAQNESLASSMPSLLWCAEWHVELERELLIESDAQN